MPSTRYPRPPRSCPGRAETADGRAGRPAQRQRAARGRAAPGPGRRPRPRRTRSSRHSWTARSAPPTPTGTSAITEDGAGGVRLKGRGTLEDAAALRAALLPLTAPCPGGRQRAPATEPPDPRDHGARPLGRPGVAAQHALTPNCHRRPTAPPPDSPSPSTHDAPREGPGGRQRRRPRPTTPSSAGWPVTPSSSPPSSAPSARSSTSAAPAAWSPPHLARPGRP